MVCPDLILKMVDSAARPRKTPFERQIVWHIQPEQEIEQLNYALVVIGFETFKNQTIHFQIITLFSQRGQRKLMV